jgi:hypothetical protein
VGYVGWQAARNIGLPQISIYWASRYRPEGERRNEALCSLRHHDIDFCPGLSQFAGEIGGFVSGNASRDPQDNPFPVKKRYSFHFSYPHLAPSRLMLFYDGRRIRQNSSTDAAGSQTKPNANVIKYTAIPSGELASVTRL